MSGTASGAAGARPAAVLAEIRHMLPEGDCLRRRRSACGFAVDGGAVEFFRLTQRGRAGGVTGLGVKPMAFRKGRSRDQCHAGGAPPRL